MCKLLCKLSYSWSNGFLRLAQFPTITFLLILNPRVTEDEKCLFCTEDFQILKKFTHRLGCGHCKRMKPEYIKAAEIVNKDGSEVWNFIQLSSLITQSFYLV